MGDWRKSIIFGLKMVEILKIWAPKSDKLSQIFKSWLFWKVWNFGGQGKFYGRLYSNFLASGQKWRVREFISGRNENFWIFGLKNLMIFGPEKSGFWWILTPKIWRFLATNFQNFSVLKSRNFLGPWKISWPFGSKLFGMGDFWGLRENFFWRLRKFHEILTKISWIFGPKFHGFSGSRKILEISDSEFSGVQGWRAKTGACGGVLGPRPWLLSSARHFWRVNFPSPIFPSIFPSPIFPFFRRQFPRNRPSLPFSIIIIMIFKIIKILINGTRLCS